LKNDDVKTGKKVFRIKDEEEKKMSARRELVKRGAADEGVVSMSASIDHEASLSEPEPPRHKSRR